MYHRASACRIRSDNFYYRDHGPDFCFVQCNNTRTHEMESNRLLCLSFNIYIEWIILLLSLLFVFKRNAWWIKIKFCNKWVFCESEPNKLTATCICMAVNLLIRHSLAYFLYHLVHISLQNIRGLIFQNFKNIKNLKF